MTPVPVRHGIDTLDLCQFIYVYPAAELVLVRLGRGCGDTYWTGLLGDLARAIHRGELD